MGEVCRTPAEAGKWTKRGCGGDYDGIGMEREILDERDEGMMGWAGDMILRHDLTSYVGVYSSGCVLDIFRAPYE